MLNNKWTEAYRIISDSGRPVLNAKPDEFDIITDELENYIWSVLRRPVVLTLVNGLWEKLVFNKLHNVKV